MTRHTVYISSKQRNGVLQDGEEILGREWHFCSLECLALWAQSQVVGAKRLEPPIQSIPTDSLPISPLTGLPYDPGLITYRSNKYEEHDCHD